MASHNITSTAFDELVCLKILQYMNTSSWTINQPFLISKTFNKVFTSEGFTRDFLMRTFKLTQIDDLQKVIDLMKEHVLPKKNKKKKKEKKESEKKKRRIDEERVTPPLNLRDVFKIYVKYSRKGDDIVVKEKVDSLMQNFNSSREKLLVSEVIDKMNCFKTGLEIQEAYNKLEQGKHNSISYFAESQYHEIPPKLFPSMFRKLKGVYVLSNHCKNRLEYRQLKNSVLVFLNCGYPLFIETNYQEEVDSYRSINERTEDLSLYGKQVFSHTIRSSQHGAFDNECTNVVSRELLNIIQSLVLTENISTILSTNKQLSKHPPQLIKERLMYAFFEISVRENAMEFVQDIEEWIPFRPIGDDNGMSDDER